MKIYGMDFTSAPRPKKPITYTECILENGILRVNNLRNLENFNRFEDFLDNEGEWILGIDFPFSLPRKLITNLKLPLSWEGYVEIIAKMDKQAFEDMLTQYCHSRPKGDKHHFRVTDKKAKSCSPMMLYGTPVGKMFYQGAPRLLKSSVSILPSRPVNVSRIVVEAYPKLVAMKWIGKRGYKNDTRKKQSDEQKTARTDIVSGLCSWELRSYYGFDIEFSEILMSEFIEDPTGDNLDALLCAIQTGWAYEQRYQGYGIPSDCDTLEGWIADPDLLSSPRRHLYTSHALALSPD
jgi:hypothetical protein